MAEVFVNRTDEYYKNIRSVREMMDNELTISHILRSENSYTASGLPYGRILASRLKPSENQSILEIGPGLGDLAENLCSSLANFSYTFADISFDVIKNLMSRFRKGRFSFVTGDFLSISFRERFDLIICNEVLADFPTIINMTMDRPKIRKGDEDAYYDAVSLIKSYRLPFQGVSNFNYGALKFLEKAKASLAEGGRIFICEHSSAKPSRIGVFGHNEYTIDFSILERAAEKIKFKLIEKGNLTKLLGIKDRKAILFYMQPELKMLYNFFRKRGILIDQRPYPAEEITAILANNGVGFSDRKKYAIFLEKHSKPLSRITDQFNYLILGT